MDPTVTDDTWQSLVVESPLPVMVDFWAPWCPPCRMQGPIFEEFAAAHAGKIRCLKLNTDEETATAGRLGIRNIPAIFFFSAGEEVAREVIRPRLWIAFGLSSITTVAGAHYRLLPGFREVR